MRVWQDDDESDEEASLPGAHLHTGSNSRNNGTNGATDPYYGDKIWGLKVVRVCVCVCVCVLLFCACLFA